MYLDSQQTTITVYRFDAHLIYAISKPHKQYSSCTWSNKGSKNLQQLTSTAHM